MKKNSTLSLFASFLFAAILISPAYAQWSLSGNSNATTSSKLGTTNSIPLRLFTNNQVRAFIATNGNLGIGTVDPQQRLHVEGSTLLNIFVSTSGLGSTSGAGMIGYTKFLPTASGQRLGYFLLGSRGGAENNYNAAGLVGYAAGSWTVGSSYPAYLTFETTPFSSTTRQERLRITADGNVGIGTSNPSNTLHVIGRGRFSDGLSVESGGIFTTYGGGDGIEAQGNSSFGAGVRGNGFYGVYGEAASSSGWGGYFSGNVFTTGSYSASDKKLKQNVADLSNAMDIINKLQPKSYEYRQDGNFKSMRLPEGKHFGLIAQELEQVLPTLVKATKFDARVQQSGNGANGQSATEKAETIDFKAVNYTELIPIVVKGMQDMDKRVRDTEAENNELRKEVAELRQLVLSLKTNASAFPASAYLAQATPNPAKGSARISYNLPEGSNKAQLQITDNLGRTIKVIQLTGSGATNVDISSLSAGVYNYSLVVDSKTVETKKLTVVK